MPTIDRRGRARRKTEQPKLSGTSLLKAMHAAVRDAEAWAELRPRAIRGLTHGAVTAEHAARMFDAYGRKPQFMPRLPPAGVVVEEVE